jgi:hypothetical protein
MYIYVPVCACVCACACVWVGGWVGKPVDNAGERGEGTEAREPIRSYERIADRYTARTLSSI